MRIYLNIPYGVISTAGTFYRAEGSIILFKNKSYNIIQSELIISFNRKSNDWISLSTKVLRFPSQVDDLQFLP